MAGDLFDTKVLNLSRGILSKRLIGPEIHDLDELISLGHNTKILQPELKIVMCMLPPVDYECDCVSPGHLCSINLGLSHELGPVVASDEAGSLS